MLALGRAAHRRMAVACCPFAEVWQGDVTVTQTTGGLTTVLTCLQASNMRGPAGKWIEASAGAPNRTVEPVFVDSMSSKPLLVPLRVHFPGVASG